MESQGYDFTESVRFLLDMYCHDADIHDVFEKSSPEHEEENRLKETMYIYNKYAYEFFRSQYDEISEESLICKSYAEVHTTSKGVKEGRWDADYCKTIGLGQGDSMDI